MKTPVLLLLFGLSALSLKAGINLDVVAVTQDEIARKTIPVTCDIVRKVDGSVTLRLSLKEPFGVVGEFIGYELRVLNKPVLISELKSEFFNLDLIARRMGKRDKIAEFEILKEEIPNSYIVITSALGEAHGMANWRSLCLSVPMLINH